jgi:hypothetical protein
MQKIIIGFLLLLILSTKCGAQNKNELVLFLKNKNISKVAKDYYQGKFKATDNAKTFSILDSIGTKNSQTRPFYLYLVTQMMKTSDGALSEELGLQAKEYIEKHPDWALSFLKGKLAAPAFISFWAKTIAGEIMIDCEGKEKQCAKKWYETADKKTSTTQKQTLVELYRQVSARCP